MTGIRRNYRNKFENDIFAEYPMEIKSKLDGKAYAWYLPIIRAP